MLCKKCNSEMILITTHENHMTRNNTRGYCCSKTECLDVAIELACVREATEKERDEILGEYVGLQN